MCISFTIENMGEVQQTLTTDYSRELVSACPGQLQITGESYIKAPGTWENFLQHKHVWPFVIIYSLLRRQDKDSVYIILMTELRCDMACHILVAART
jgi:hypothetical protein